jgi:hypothetical protein
MKYTWLSCIAILLFACQTKTPNQNRNYNNLKFGTLPVAVKANFNQQQSSAHVLVEPEYYVWGTSVVKWNDKYHAYYSRWQKKYKHKGWLTYCEIVHAESDNPEGPFEFVNVVLKSENKEGWDINNAHNPYAIVAEGKINLYYIANDIGHLKTSETSETYQSDSLWYENNRIAVRNSQCIGMASASSPEGPFTRTKNPVVKPDNVLFKNIAVNPAVVFHNNKYTMIMKGDDVAKAKWFRIQLVGDSENPDGPFKFLKKPVYDKAQTEDACIWYDQELDNYYMVCHVMGKRDLALFYSDNGKDWEPHERSVFMKKEFLLEDGTLWKPERLERPFVLTDDTGKPIMLYVAIADQGINGNIAIPIHHGE